MKPLGRKRPAQPDQRCGIFDNGLIRSINIYLVLHRQNFTSKQIN